MEPKQPSSNEIAANPNAELRAFWGRRVNAVKEYTMKQYENECRHYVKMLRHEFTGLMPQRLLQSDRIDVNVVYPIVKNLIPALYFQDPKVYVRPLQEKIFKKVLTEAVNPDGSIAAIDAINPETGEPLVEEYDAVRSGIIFQGALNKNIKQARLKQQVKSAIVDAHVMFYGAVKCGWGNDQGVASMGAGAPPSVREDVNDDLAYAIRLKPWHVLIDCDDFYNPAWIAIKYVVHPAQLKNDKRLRNTHLINGQAEVDFRDKQDLYKNMAEADKKRAEYFEIYAKPCAEYPNGKFFMLSNEVKDDFLYDSDWPLAAKEFPVKILFFNEDPEGGLPIPDVRYYGNHQKAKVNIRNAEYEYVQRTIPMLGINLAGVKNPEQVYKEITSGQMPRVVATTQNPDRVLRGVAYPNLTADFRALDLNVDQDISKMVGMTAPLTQGSAEFATDLKLANRDQQIRQNERADIVSDFITDIVTYWAKLYQEFAGPENYTTIEGEKFPVKWSRDEINGEFTFELKPFSMSYEDPMVKRKQYVDLLNLLGSPEVRAFLAEQGVQVDGVKIVKRVLETYDERDVETFIIDEAAKPENQVMDALQENQALSVIGSEEARLVQVEPTDNHKLHILIHSLLGDVALEHIEAHNQAILQTAQAASPGGGNKEGLPVGGVAANQELMTSSPAPSATNEAIALNREAEAI